jgi:hypothetical protein
MADQFDRAQDEDARQTAFAIAAQQRQAASAPKLEATGECLNPLCGEDLDPPRLFCGPSCAQEHARRCK